LNSRSINTVALFLIYQYLVTNGAIFLIRNLGVAMSGLNYNIFLTVGQTDLFNR